MYGNTILVHGLINQYTVYVQALSPHYGNMASILQYCNYIGPARCLEILVYHTL